MTGAKLLVDLRSAQAEATWERGLPRWVRGLADELIRRPDRCAGVLVDPGLPPPRGLSPDLAASPLLVWNTATDVRDAVESAEGPVVYLQTSPFEFQAPVGEVRRNWFVPEHVAALGLPVVAVVYDLIPLRDPSYFRSAAARRRFADHAELLAGIDHIVTISDRTRREVLDLLEVRADRVTTIGTGVDPYFLGSGPDSTIAARQWGPPVGDEGHGDGSESDDRDVVLCVGGDDPRKNVDGLVAAWGRTEPELRRRARLLVVCRAGEPTLDAWRRCRDEAGLTAGDVHFATSVDDDGLMAAYLAAELVVMPSHDEGFGLPVAEAVALGRPVVTSSTGAVPEILELPASTFDPTDPDDMARVITAALSEPGLRAEIAARVAERRHAVTWPAVADRLGAVVDRLAPAARRWRSTPLRLALVGPLPPTPSGIADHTALVLDTLAERAEVHAFVPHDPAGTRRLRSGHAVFRAADLLDRIDPHGYDAVICCLGNSGGHDDTVEVTRRLPTILWLHEVRLPALQLHRWFARGDVADLAIPVLQELYPGRAPETTARDLMWSVQGYADAGIGMTHDLVRGARAVVVSSQVAARLLAADQPPHHPMPPVYRIPLARPDPWPTAVTSTGAGESGTPAAPARIVALGVVAHHKVPERLIDAVAELAGRGLHVMLTFIGDGPDLYFEELARRAAAAGVAHRVELAGHLPRDELVAHVRDATLAVQLRRSSHGESSAAVLDAMALGVPVVTNMSSAAELPAGSVEVLPPGADSGVVAGAVAELIADAGRRRRLATAALAACAARSAGDVADELLATVIDVQARTRADRRGRRPPGNA